MPVPGQPPLPALTQWLVDNRRPHMKLSELAEKLTAAGYRNRDGYPITDTTLRGWESRSGGVPQSAVPYLERIFKSQAPGGGPMDIDALVRSNLAVAEQISDLVHELRKLALGQRDLEQKVALVVGRLEGIPPLAEDRDATPDPDRAGAGQSRRPVSGGR